MVVWGLALTISAGLHWWGLQRPDPLQTSWTLALLLVFVAGCGVGCMVGCGFSIRMAAGETQRIRRL